MVEQLVASRGVEFRKRGSENPHIGNGKIQAFGSGRRDNVRRIPCQVEPAGLHRLHDETAHPRNTFLQDGPFGKPVPVESRQARLQFFPDPGIRPLR